MQNVFKLPKEFAELDKHLSALSAHLNQIDKDIENLPPDKGYKLDYHPPGFKPAPEFTREQRKQSMLNQKSELQKEMMSRVADEVTYADDATAKEVLEKADARVHGAKYTEMTTEQFIEAAKDHKTLDQSQEYARVKGLYEQYQGKNSGQQTQKDEEIKASINAFVQENSHPDSKGVDAKEQATKENPSPDATEKDIDEQISASIAAFVVSSEYSQNNIDITTPSQGVEREV